ncbi:MAG: transcriptional regulator [Acidobacteria bacterium]|nr:transcriptional regulator [Acidobacteriota bacterium]
MATKRQPAAGRPASEPRKPVDVRKVAETPQRLDRLIHDRARLGIVSALAAQSPLSFSELKSLLEMTDGNLSVHARKLEEAGYIACEKGFEGRVPRTEFSLTGEGRRAFQTYLDHMESLIKAMKKG